MANFESPIGNKSFSGQPMKEFNVPDETGFTPKSPVPQMVPLSENDIRAFQARLDQQFNTEEKDPIEVEREIRAAREARRTGKERLNGGSIRRIEMLIGMTRLTREVEIEGNSFVFRSLKGKEMREAATAASEFDGTVQLPYEIRRQLLARSISSIAGIELEQFIGSSTLDSKLLFVDELDEALSSRLYNEYVILSIEAKEKYSIKTVEEAQEVSDDLKK